MKNQISLVILLAIVSLIIVPIQTDAQEFKVRGRLHMDALYGINDAEAFSNGFNNRRARLGASGKLNANWDGQIEVDFADAGIAANDFRLRRSFENGGRFWIGQFKVPQGLNELTSSNEITFIERSSANNSIVDSRRMGLAYDYAGKTAGFKSMVYGRALGQRSSLKDDMPIGVGARAFAWPEIAGGILHIGASVAFEDLQDTTSLRFADRPEARDSKGGSVRLISASVADAKNTLKTGFELLYLNGPFSVEGEFNRVAVSTYSGNDPAFYGFHAQGSYVIGGARSYSKGAVRGVRPGENGAWEVALRYSFVNLNDGDFKGGEQTNITLGLNRYVSSNLRFMANVIVINSDRPAYADKTPVLGLLRAQYSF